MKYLVACFALLAGLLCSCGQELQFNVIVYDSCAQTPLANDALEFLELEVDSDSLDEPVRTVWPYADRRGSFPDLQPVSDSVVTVVARDGSGSPGRALAAGAVGLVDLSGANDDLVELSIVVGDVDTFILTTNTDTITCESQETPRRNHTATRLGDGRVLIVGGASVGATASTLWTSSEFYNPRTGFFSNGPEIRNGREGHTATLLNDGRVLIAGGDSGGPVGTLRAAQIYDPGNNSFGSSLQMKEQRAYHTATRLPDGRVLLVGGVRDGAPVASTEIFDPVTDTFSVGPTLNHARAYHSAVRVGSTVAVLGGRGASALVAEVEFVSTSGPVLAGPNLAEPRSHVAAEVIPGRDAIFVAGGFGTFLSNPQAVDDAQGLSTFEVIELNPSNLEASTSTCASGSLIEARGDATLASTGSGLLLVGGVGNGREVSGTGERIIFSGADICSPTLAETAFGLTMPRAGAQLTPLYGGDLLVTGGYTFDPALPLATRPLTSVDTAEVYIVER